MKTSSEDYVQVLKLIDPSWKIQAISKNSIKTHGILFRLSTARPKNSKDGVLLERVSLNARKKLEENKISYIGLDGKVFIALKNGILRFETNLEKAAKKPTHFSLKRTLPPTLLVSPYAFQILDVLFRLPDQELTKFSSALAFCKTYGLEQSRISRMMTTLRAHSLVELKSAIRRIDLPWWDEAFSYPPVRRHLVSFTCVAETYKALDPTSRPALIEGVLRSLRGPTDPPKQIGLLKDSIQTLWCEEKQLPALKRLIKAIPADSTQAGSLVQIAVPAKGYKNEALRTCTDPSKLKSWIGAAFGPLNIFHVLFDLSFFDERTRLSRDELLRRVMNET